LLNELQLLIAVPVITIFNSAKPAGAKVKDFTFFTVLLPTTKRLPAKYIFIE